jgi:hypothetical protein
MGDAGEVFAGTTSDMRKDNPWLASEDLIGSNEVILQIDVVKFYRQAQFDGGRKEDVYAVHFAKGSKALVLGATNRRRLTTLFGTKDVRAWSGKWCTLYVEKFTKPAFGDKWHGIRVKYPDAKAAARNRGGAKARPPQQRVDKAGDQRPPVEPEDESQAPDPAPASKVETERPE